MLSIVNGDCIVRAGEEPWRLVREDIAVVGEYTTDAGPGNPDYFYVFVSWSGAWFECEHDEVVQVSLELRQFFESPLIPLLLQETNWKHRVLWPDRLHGLSLFEVTMCRPKALWRRLLNQQDESIALSEAVRDYLELRDTDAVLRKCGLLPAARTGR